MMLRISLLLLTGICTIATYKILVISPIPAKSHAILGDGIVRHLVDAGHEITYVTALVPSTAHPKVTIVEVGDKHWLDKGHKKLSLEAVVKNENGILELINTFSLLEELSTMTLDSLGLRELINDENQRFDAIIAEYMFTDTYAGFAGIFECPFIWLSTVEPHWRIMRLIDERLDPTYSTDIQSTSIPPFTFGQRVQELGLQIFGRLLDVFFLDNMDLHNYNKFLVPAIIKRGRPVPSFEELKYNASLILGNSHVSLGIPTRVPENYKHIGGYHIQDTVKPLPEDLRIIMESARHGVIYFSMGSHLKSKTFPIEIKQNLLKMFGTLKQTVLWKLEENLPNIPNKVHFVSTRGQLPLAAKQLVRANPNLLCFITHGGQLSTTESVHYGVPIIGIPVYSDQYTNVGRAVKKGFAIKVDLTFSLADSLKETINEMLTNDMYRNKVKELSEIYHDRVVSPGKELVHWVEHVIKTNGAPHMRSPALMMPWYQKYYLDLLLVLILTVYIVKYCLKWVISNKNMKQKTQ